MSLQKTNLIIQSSHIPATFAGTPDDLATEIVRRMQIVSPSGTTFIFTGDVEPTSNVGPWLKDGTKWYVFDPDTKRYVPLDITDSQVTWYWLSNSTPASSTPSVWLKTTKDATEDDPSTGQPISWYHFDGARWIPFISVVLSGTTAERPSVPVEYQQFFDTTISTLIWWERDRWRTVSGVPGDIKAVAFTTLESAIVHNPGWDVLGAGNENIRGRFMSQATRDTAGSGGTTDLSIGVNIPARQAFEIYGTNDTLKIDGTGTLTVPTIAFWYIVKL